MTHRGVLLCTVAIPLYLPSIPLNIVVECIVFSLAIVQVYRTVPPPRDSYSKATIL